MIYVKKPEHPPEVMRHDVFLKIATQFKKFYQINSRQRRQDEAPKVIIPRNVLVEIRSRLNEEFNGKCAFCESTINGISADHFERFRPRSSAKGLHGEFSLDHYWTISYEWNNFLYVCYECARHKANWFPVESKRSRLGQIDEKEHHRIRMQEKNLLVDPCFDNPEEYFKYDLTHGRILPIHKAGEVTIELLGLNRKHLMDLRLQQYYQYQTRVNLIEKISPGSMEYKQQTHLLSEEIYGQKSNVPYLGMLRFYFRELAGTNSRVAKQLKQAIRLHPSKSKKVVFTDSLKVPSFAKKHVDTASIKRIIIESVEINNFKSLKSIQMEFPRTHSKNQSWLMLLGENGVGKSSFLQAIAMALIGDVGLKKIGIKASDVLTQDANEGHIKIHCVGAPPIELSFDKKQFKTTGKKINIYLLGYGSTRLSGLKVWKPKKSLGKIRISNLFDPSVTLFSEEWLLKLYNTNAKGFDYAARALKAMLSKEFNDPQIKLRVRQNEIFVQYSDKKRKPDKLHWLSDGFKSVIAMACDMMQFFMTGNTTMQVMEGIVLIDEIGTHLHPRWKMRVVQSFRLAFPQMQFIVTTHDPLCLKGLLEGEVVVFYKNETGEVRTLTNLPAPGELRAEQLLSSKFFGLRSTVDDEIETDFNDYYFLLSKTSLTKKEKNELARLEEKLRDKKHLGNSLREELALSAADTILARDERAENQKGIPQLKQETVNILQDMWDKSSF